MNAGSSTFQKALYGAVRGTSVAVIGVGAFVTAFAVAAIVVLLTVAVLTLIPAVVLMLIWNWAAPSFQGIPLAYQHFEFLQVWSVTILISFVSRLLFGGIRITSRES